MSNLKLPHFDFDSATKYIEKGGKSKIAYATELLMSMNGNPAIFHHDSPIVEFFPDGGRLFNNHGWQTSTTRHRMNFYAPPGYAIGQKKGKQLLTEFSTGKQVEFDEQISMIRKGNDFLIVSDMRQ